MNALATFYDAFLDAVMEQRPRALQYCLDDPARADDAIVYRNTIFRGSADALATAYPAVARMAGAAFFDTLAVAYVASAPPRTRSLVGYGQDLAAFLSEFPGAEAAPYLADAARLDRAWLEAHLAPDAPSLTATDLSASAPEDIAALKLALHPSVHIVSLTWNVYNAWVANRLADGSEQQARTVDRIDTWVLLWRLDNEVQHRRLGQGEATFLRALQSGQSLGEAATTALQAADDFDTSSSFAGALNAGVLASFQNPGAEGAT